MIKNRCYMRTGLVPVFYCAAFIMPSLSYAADPVSVNEANRKIMYGTAAVRPTPDAFDLASRGMCYVATDTGTVTEWTGTAWITTATCPGSSTGSGGTQYTEGDTDASITGTAMMMEGAGNALVPAQGTAADGQLVNLGSNNDVVVTVAESSATLGDVDVDDAVGNIVVTIDTGAIAATRCSLKFLNEDEAANATIDEWYIFLNPASVTSLTNVTAYTEADFASPSGNLLMVRTGAPSGEADVTPDTTLDETDVLMMVLDVSGIDNVVIEAGASADNADVTYWYTCN